MANRFGLKEEYELLDARLNPNIEKLNNILDKLDELENTEKLLRTKNGVNI